MKRNELEERLIEYSVSVIGLLHSLPDTKTSNHLSGQLLRSGTSAALNYGEAQSGESRKDFIHKIKVILKELRESLICLKIMHRSNQFSDEVKMLTLIKETNELVAIFTKSAQTAERNQISAKT